MIPSVHCPRCNYRLRFSDIGSSDTCISCGLLWAKNLVFSELVGTAGALIAYFIFNASLPDFGMAMNVAQILVAMACGTWLMLKVLKVTERS